ncbi:MAG: SIS domain-containing protein [Longimicrobiales bacterium]|nr:SIS domain-containing protein [Longimicrobiales bacterium]
MSAHDTIAAHLAEHREVLREVEAKLSGDVAVLARTVEETLRSGGKLLFCGNGGSAADAQHLAAEYVVRFAREREGLPAIALTTDTSVLTAAGNDYGFQRVFQRQVEALGREGDLLILHSTSGESENLVHAARAAAERSIRTVGLLGKGGGRLAGEVDMALVVPGDSTARAQEMHLLIGHIVCDLVDRALAGAPEGTGPKQSGSD